MAELLPFQKLQLQITAYIRDPEHSPAPANVSLDRLDVYKELLYNGLLETLSSVFQVCHEILTPQQFKTLVRGFFKDYRTESPYFQDIPKDFLAYLATLDSLEHYPAFLYELAHYEWVELALELENTKKDLSVNPHGNLLTEHPVFSNCAWLLHYQFPVHKIGKDFQPSVPPEDATFLIVYRNLENQIKFMHISLLTAHLINRLLQNETLSGEAALLELVEATQAKDKDSFIKDGLNDLKTLQQQSIILGTRSFL